MAHLERPANRVIRYLTSKAALATLKSCRLRVSEASKFNDPFEFSMIYRQEDGSEFPHDVLRRGIDANIRVLSVCDEQQLDSNGDILMWSHYAERHSGFRIHLTKKFLTSKKFVYWPVDYGTVIPTIDTDYIRDLDGGSREIEAFEALCLALRAKGLFWCYEKEVRFFFEKRRCHFDRRTGFHYLPLPYRAITRIDIGLHTSEHAERQMRRLLSSSEFSHVELRKAEKVRGRFSLEYAECK